MLSILSFFLFYNNIFKLCTTSRKLYLDIPKNSLRICIKAGPGFCNLGHLFSTEVMGLVFRRCLSFIAIMFIRHLIFYILCAR